ncbi:MAG: hypothetical protein IPK16_28585 [Anaerolineales bacterium]|nr:hypothetical protein [Anaerolineales bacterium]
MDGQIGDGTTEDRSAPTDVVGIDGEVVAIDAGRAHTCAVLRSETVVCWGNNRYGELGDTATMGGISPSPRVVTSLDSVASIALGQFHSCAKLNSGSVACWGYNGRGQLGR